MRKIGDLVITLQNERGEDIEIRTKKIGEACNNLRHWKEPEIIKVPKQFTVSLETAITTLESIFKAGVTRPKTHILHQGVY